MEILCNLYTDNFLSGATKLLISADYKLVYVKSTEEIIEELSCNQFGCMLLEHSDKISAVKIIDSVRNVGIDTPAIVFTNDTTEEIEIAIRQLNPVAFFVNPINFNSLLKVVNHINSKGKEILS